ncbi:2-iminoacetate synthase ThiH [soil metagenome]
MSFSTDLPGLLREKSPLLRGFESLLAPRDDRGLEAMARQSATLTRRYFGRTMRLFAPLYLSNECINSCSYCGFSRENSILRVTLELEEVAKEAAFIVEQGFRNILLVAGEHPKFVSGGYMEACIRRLAPIVPSVSLEVAPMETEDYIPLVAAGAEGLVVYQETYHPPTYATMHVAGPKKDYGWRLDCPERAYAAGFRRLGVGALFGLWNWQEEAMALAAHIEYLSRTCWKAQITVSLPRLRPAAGEFQPTHPLPDREFIQLLCALRLTFPHVGLVMSTREPGTLRDMLAPLGVTMMSAGSHTEPGGYTGQGVNNLHTTVGGRQIAAVGEGAEGQFSISDERSPEVVAARLRELGLEPVWKDWDAAILSAA